MTFHYFFLKCTFQHSICNSCHDLTMLNVIIRDIVIITVKGIGYCCIIHHISNSEAILLSENFVLDNLGYI